MLAATSSETFRHPIGSIATFAARRPLLAFVAAAFMWSWTVAWLQPVLPGGAGPVFQFGPALAAVPVSRASDQAARHDSSARRSLTFAVIALPAFLVWVSFFSLVVVTARTIALLINGAVVAALAGFVVTNLLGRVGRVNDLLSLSSFSQTGWRWYAMALLLLPTTFLLGIGLSVALGERIPVFPNGGPSPLWALAFAWIMLFGGGMEEAGWRGFALRRLQVRCSPLVASLVLSGIWAAWHTPEYFNGFYAGAATSGSLVAGIAIRLLLFTPPLAILMTWAFNGSGGSLPIAVLMHAGYNLATTMLPLTSTAYLLSFIVQWVMAVVVVFAEGMWRRGSNGPEMPPPPADSRAARRLPRDRPRRKSKRDVAAPFASHREDGTEQGAS